MNKNLDSGHFERIRALDTLSDKAKNTSFILNRQNRQNRSSKAARNAQPSRAHPVFLRAGPFLLFALLLTAIFAALFAKSFLPDYVHFSNDGPLGEVNAEYERVPSVLTGVWSDLNDIGTSGGAMAPDITALISGVLGPVGYSKFFQPLCLIILGLGAWTFFRSLKLSPLAAILGGLAAALNGSYFGNACWGTASAQIAMGMTFLALAAFVANTSETPPLIRWLRIALAGMAVGVSVMEGFDNGAIFSLFVAAFVFFKSLFEDTGPALTNVGRGIGRVAVIAIFAFFIAAQTVSSLFLTYIHGAGGTDPSTGAPDSLQHWDYMTQWSLPKKETLGVFVPGLFGYRMDTPTDMMGFLQNHYVGGQYWGGMGRAPELDRFLDSGKSGPPPSGMQDWWRFGYAGYYCGILVALVACFAMAQSLRRSNSIFPLDQRRLIWFWAVAMIAALLISWGRFGPFDGYPFRLLYKLPGVSYIRNPAKLMAVFNLAMIINFGFGIDGLCRQYLQTESVKLKGWWARAKGFDRNWALGSLAVFALSVFAWLIYWSQKDSLVRYLPKVGFPDLATNEQIASFSIGQVGWFLLFFAAAVILVILVIAGVFSGKRARIVGSVLLGVLLVADLGRADLPWIIHWNYKEKYEVDPGDSAKSTNPIINLLIDKPYEHRVVSLNSGSSFDGLYRIEWMQQQFPFYNVQCLDVIQSPRMDSDLAAYDMALIPTQTAIYHKRRQWELSNTSYILDPAPFADMLNEQLDPVQRRFHIVQRFQMVPKPGIDNPTDWEQVTAQPDTNGDYALIQFTGALPRAKLYTNWQVSTNGDATLQTLASEDFDPHKTVLVSSPLPVSPANNSSDKDSGTVEIKSYHPKDIVLAAQATAPSVLLLNDKYDPNWRVLVDGKRSELFRANYIMRGVFLPAGAHTVEFEFSLPHKPLYVSVIFVFLAIVLSGVLFFATWPTPIAVATNKRQLIVTN